jgi:dipeptide/tripeptide permease
MSARTPFPRVFWVANAVEILERFAYYGIYFGFGIYMESLGYSRGQLGVVQSIFLMLSYVTPVISGTMADRYGFKKVLVVSYLAYLPSILLLLLTRSFSGIALTMLTIGLAAGIFKPLVSGTVRVVTDGTNKSLGFGIFYALVNLGASLGPLVAARLRAISWNHAFVAAAVAIFAMLAITLLFYEEPPRAPEHVTLARKLAEIGEALSDPKFATFLVLLGVFFWLPFWAFFNLLAVYVDRSLDGFRLYEEVRGVVGAGVADFLSRDDGGRRRILGEAISHSGWVIVALQLLVTRIFERRRPIPTFLLGLGVATAGFALIGLARSTAPGLVFGGIVLFAIGEMISSPRIQEYITWIAPREKAGLYMGSNFLALGIGGALSGVTYTTASGWFQARGQPEGVWYVLAAHVAVGIVVLAAFFRLAGEFQEQSA